MQTKKFNIKNILSNYALYFIMILMVIVIGSMSPKFFSWRVLRDILMQSSTRIIVALGCLFILISGSADLSGGRTVGLTAVIAGSLAQKADYYIKFWNLPELPPIVPIFAAVLVGLIVGLLNGFTVSKLKVPAFLATLGWMMVVYGTNLLLCNKPPNNSQPLGGFLKNFTNLGSGNIAGIPIIVFFALGMCIIVHVLLTKTTLGREIFSVGSNAEAARVSGINVFKIQMITFALAGACYGLAGALEAARIGSANSSYGNGYEMDAIASCIVGGCSMTGGVGSVIGVFLGVIIFNVINYGLTFIGLSSYWQWVVKGLIIIIAVSIDMRKYSSNK